MLRGYPLLCFYFFFVFSFFIIATSGLPLSNHHHRFKVPGSLPTETISIIDLGGDPTGKNVSDDAFAAAFVTASTIAKGLNLGSVGSGSVTIDLGGGTYVISKPVSVYGQGFTISGGTILADVTSNGWPDNSCLLDVVGSQNIALESLTLDGAHVTGGSRFDNVVQVSVTSVFILHYKTFGIHGDDSHGASHELMVNDCFFAEFMWGEPGFDNIDILEATGIYLEKQFYDSNFYNSIIRCTRVGIVNLAGANLFHGMHVYATCNKNPDAYNVSVGLVQGAWSQTRIINSYWDDSPLVLTSPNQVTLKDNLFYGLSGLIIAPSHTNFAASGVLVSGNIFTSTPYSGNSPQLHYDVKNGTINSSSLSAFVVADNFVSAGGRTTRVSATTSASASALSSSSTPSEIHAALLSAVFNGTIDLRSSLLLLPGGTPSPSFDWRRAASPVLLRMASQHQKGQFTEEDNRRTLNEEREKVAANLGDAFGGALSQLQATAVLTSLSFAGVTLPMSNVGATPIVAITPTDTPGVLSLLVSLQPLPGGVSSLWIDVVEKKIKSDGTFRENTASWNALVSVQADQAQPLVAS